MPTAHQPFDAAAAPCIPSLRRRAAFRLGGAAEADDAVQEALLRAFQAYHALDDTRLVGAWLARIVDRVVTDRKRRAGRRRAIAPETPMDDTLAEALPCPMAGADAALQGRQRRERLAVGIADLPAEQRAVLELRISGASVEVIADRLALPRGTVMSRLGRARRRLRDALGDA